MNIQFLVKLSARAWSLEILAALAAGCPARQAPLIAATGAGRSAFRGSLEHLVMLDLLERNPGHGHPLRPEFRLTAKGVQMAEAAVRIVRMLPEPSDLVPLRRAWTLPILSLTAQPQRFSQVKAGLPKISDRALSLSLQGLEAQGWMRRELTLTARLPYPTYQAVNQGAEVAQTLASAA